MGYKTSYADPDVWTHTEMKSNGFEYYEYIWCYINGVFFIDTDTGKSINNIQDNWRLKDENISEPDMYLEATLSNILLDFGNACYMM